MKITSHTLVKNEGRFVWFSIISIIDYVDKVLVWDTGSTDGTKKILKEIKRLYPKKVELNLLKSISVNDFPKIRQQMLEHTQTDWFIVADGDEIWFEDSIKKITNFINKYGNEYESIVVPTINLVGDIYHYQEKAAGNYHLAGKIGHLNLRAINMNIPGLSSSNPHGTWGWTDENKQMVQNRDVRKIKYLDAPYLHATFLQRSLKKSGDILVPKRSKKLKHELGIPFPKDYFYPEAFFRSKPSFISNPWAKMSVQFYVQSALETPFRKIKRRLLPTKVGY